MAPRRGLRVNRALRITHSRRATERFIKEGRLAINGKAAAHPEQRLRDGDIVTLNGVAVAWADVDTPHRHFKYHKPLGVEVTMNRDVSNNIAAALLTSGLDCSGDTSGAGGSVRRIYPVGRLDVNSSGLLLLTSDGVLLQDLCAPPPPGPSQNDESSCDERGGAASKRKFYTVTTQPRASDANVAELAAGVLITTPARRNGSIASVTALTLPCGTFLSLSSIRSAKVAPLLLAFANACSHQTLT